MGFLFWIIPIHFYITVYGFPTMAVLVRTLRSPHYHYRK